MTEECIQSELTELAVGDDGPLGALRSYIDRVQDSGFHLLRCGLVAAEGAKAIADTCKVRDGRQARLADRAIFSETCTTSVALIVPTGVGASIGGFIGDAGPAARAIESVADRAIIHPNVVNGADLYGGGNRSLYVDGYTLDEFFLGRVGLKAGSARRIGLILDRMENEQRVLILNAANACCAVWGIDLVGYAECEEPVRATVDVTPMQHFVGRLENASVLFGAAERIIRRGAEVIGVVTAIGGVPRVWWEEHYRGRAINPVGAMEALISRVITWKTGLPCAHSPAYVDGMAEAGCVVHPRAAAEVISRTGLPCILKGLAHAAVGSAVGGIAVADLSAIVVPFGCAGGVPALAAQKTAVPLVAVKKNRCVVGVDAGQLGLTNRVIVENYAEAIAYIICQKAGVSWNVLNGNIGGIEEV